MDITNKYHNSKIYQITDIAYTKCYIGSTTESLSLRMARHRHHYRQFLKNNKNFISSYELFKEYGVENCKIQLIEYYKCDSLAELRKREGEHIKKTDCVNKRVEGRTQKEYKIDNKERLRENEKVRWAKYYEEHKEEILAQKKEYRQQNRDKISEREKYFYQNDKDKIAQKSEYRQQNRDTINEKAKAYREANKEKVNEKMKEYREKSRDEINARRREKRKQQKEQHLISTKTDTTV